MVIYLYGTDSYRRTRKLRELIAMNRAKQPNADLLVLDLQEVTDPMSALKDFLFQPSMFADSKTLVILESGEVPEKSEKELLKLLKNELESKKTFIIISDSWVKPRKAFMFLTESPTKAQEFQPLTGSAFHAFMKKEADARKIVFQADAWKYLLSHLQGIAERSSSGVNELEKISLAGFSQPISKQDVESLISHHESQEVFNAARVLMSGSDRKKKIAVLERLLADGEEPARLFNLLAYNAQGAQAVYLADLDIAVKSGRAEYEEALLGFVLGKE